MTPVDDDSMGGSIKTDLYFVGGVPAGMSESDLSSFFSQFAFIDTVALRSSKSPASKGFAFLRTKDGCDLVGLAGPNPEISGQRLNIEVAQDPTMKLHSQQRQTLCKVFIGNIPLHMIAQHLLQELQKFGPVDRLTRFKVKSDRTKYCYAIMQHLEDATSMTNMKRLKVTDQVNHSSQFWLVMGAFNCKGKEPSHLLESKYPPGGLRQKTTTPTSLPFNESLGSKLLLIEGNTFSSNIPICLDQSSFHEGQALTTKEGWRKKQSESRSCGLNPAALSSYCKAGELKPVLQETKTTVAVSLRRSLALTTDDSRHEMANLRFNILLS